MGRNTHHVAAAAGPQAPEKAQEKLPEKAQEKIPEKAQEKGAADKGTVIEKGGQKGSEKASEKGKAAAAGGGALGAGNAPAAVQPSAPRDDGSWSSTTEQTQTKAKR